MRSIPCDVVLLPDDELAQKAISASQQLAPYDSLFTLEIGRFYPHMSLYMFELNEDDVQKVEMILKELAQNLHAIRAKATTYRLGEGFGIGYIDPEYEITQELQSLQNQIIEKINPVRADMRESDKAKMQDATGLKLENLEKYGYPAVGQLFRPHMTLTRLKEHRPEVLEILPAIDTFKGAFNCIGIFEMGDNGTCIRKINEYTLGSSLLR